MVAADDDDLPARGGRRDPEAVAVALHHEDRHRHGVQLAQPVRRHRAAGTCRWLEGEGEAQHPRGTRCRGGPAGHPGAGGPSPEHERQASQAPGAQVRHDRRPRDVELRCGRRGPPAGDAIGLLDQRDGHAEAERHVAGQQEIGGLHAAAGAVAEEQGPPRRAARAVQVDPRRPVRRLDLERRWHLCDATAVPAYVAFLRAINLGPRNKVAMPALREALEAAGLRDVRTHLNTGNVLLTSRRRSAAALEEEVAAVLRDDLGVDVAVIARTADEVAAVAASHPLGEPGAKGLAVGFLQAEPATEAAARLDEADFGGERFELRGRELYLLYPNGLGRSKMTGAFFERTLRVPVTVRTHGVVRQVADLAAVG